jgi:hypothetical protein
MSREDFKVECRDRGLYCEPVGFTRDMLLLYKGHVVGWVADNPLDITQYNMYVSEFRVMEIDLQEENIVR